MNSYFVLDTLFPVSVRIDLTDQISSKSEMMLDHLNISTRDVMSGICGSRFDTVSSSEGAIDIDGVDSDPFPD